MQEKLSQFIKEFGILIVLLLITYASFKLYQWSIKEAIEYSRFAAFLGVQSIIATGVHVVDVFVLRRYSILEEIFQKQNRAVAILIGAIFVGSCVAIAGT